MPVYFGDSSALVKRYITETGSAWLTARIDPNAGSRVFIAHITVVEIVSAIIRREKGGHLVAVDAANALNAFQQDYKQEFSIVPLTVSLVDDAVSLAKKYALRGYDAVQLATALQTQQKRTNSNLSPLTLLSADTDLNSAAVSEGLTVEDPDDH